MEPSFIYFERTVVAASGTRITEIAVVERQETATRYEAQGFHRCSYARFRAAWQARDMTEFQRQWSALAPEARASTTPALSMEGSKSSSISSPTT
jgi:hypothetical protein